MSYKELHFNYNCKTPMHRCISGQNESVDMGPFHVVTTNTALFLMNKTRSRVIATAKVQRPEDFDFDFLLKMAQHEFKLTA